MDLVRLGRRTDILRLQEAMLSHPDRLDVAKDTPVRHVFAPGCYVREMTIPEGTLIIGKIHRHAHVNILSAGRCRVFTEGEGTRELVAPCTFVSTPGTKRVVLALENTIWSTVHPTNETDLSKIEQEVIAPTYGALEDQDGLGIHSSRGGCGERVPAVLGSSGCSREGCGCAEPASGEAQRGGSRLEHREYHPHWVSCGAVEHAEGAGPEGRCAAGARPDGCGTAGAFR